MAHTNSNWRSNAWTNLLNAIIFSVIQLHILDDRDALSRIMIFIF